MEHVLPALNYALVLFYGSFLSTEFSGGIKNKKELGILIGFSFFILIVQTWLGMSLGLGRTKELYPFVTHIPTILLLIFGLKKSPLIAVISVFMAYFFCQLPRWMGAIAEFIFGTRMSYLIVYAIFVVIFYFLINRYFVKPAYYALTYSKKSMIIVGILPVLYYFFDYGTTVYSDLLYQGSKMIAEFLPAVMVIIYMLFVVIYHSEVQRRSKAELNSAMLSMELGQAATDIQNAKASQEMARIYRHDMRHHLLLLHGLAEMGDLDKIKSYLNQAQKEMDDITPTVFCDNEVANLILSSYDSKAKDLGINLACDVQLPQKLNIPDTELCSFLSNGLENAITAASKMEDSSRRIVRVNCSINRNKLLIMIQNYHKEAVHKKDGIPTSQADGHGFGCRSMSAIAEKRHGFVTFKSTGALFTMRAVLLID